MKENKEIEATNQLNADSLEAVAGGWTDCQKRQVLNDLIGLVTIFSLSENPFTIFRRIVKSYTYEEYQRNIVPMIRKKFFNGGVSTVMG